MAYGDNVDSKQKAVSILLTALLSGLTVLAMWLAFNPEYAKKLIANVSTFDVKEPEPEPEPPPPPPEEKELPPPPIDAPPPIVKLNTPSPVIVPPVKIEPVQITPKAEGPPKVAEPVKVVPPPEPPKKNLSAKAKPRGNPARWASTDDYPSRDLREENEGVTRFSVTVGTDGRVTGCNVTGSSGHPGLDQATCRLVTSRARFEPALDADGNPTTGSYASSVRWVIPKE